MKALGLDGITVSPGYAYERAPDQQHFLNRNKTKELFRGILARGRGGKAWPFSQSINFLNFLAGNQSYQCTPWGNPTRTVFGWQKPCYLLGEGYAKTFRELMDTTEWDKYGVGKYEKCADCMVHCGFEASAVKDMVRRPLKAAGRRVARRAHRRRDGEGHPARRPAAGGVRLLRPCRAEAYRDPGRQVRDPAAGGRGVRRERPSRPPGRCGSAPAIARAPAEVIAGRPADRHCRPLFMPTRAAGGSVRSRRIGDDARRYERQADGRRATRAAATCDSMSTAMASPARRSSAFCAAVAAIGIDAEQDAALRRRQARDQPVATSRDRSAALAAIAHGRRRPPSRRPQSRRQRARDADADDAAHAGRQALEHASRSR